MCKAVGTVCTAVGTVRESEYLCTLKRFISPFFRPIYWEKGPDFLFIFGCINTTFFSNFIKTINY